MAGAFGDLLGQAGVTLPNISMAGASQYLIYFLVGILLAGGGGWGYWLWYSAKQFNITIILHKKIQGKVRKVATYKGQLQRVGQAGDFWLFVKGVKKRVPRPKIWASKNEAWYFEREDGEWINFEMGDIDEQMKQAGAYYVDEDMRLQRLGIQKNLNDRLTKESFWSKYGTTIMMVIFCVIVTICLVMLFKELKAFPPAMADASTSIRDMALAVKDLSNCVNGGVVNPTINPLG